MASISTENVLEGTSIVIHLPRVVPLSSLGVVFEDLGLQIQSFGTEKDVASGSQTPGGVRPKPSRFRGKFLVTDEEGNALGDHLVVKLVAALEEVLHVTLQRHALKGSDSQAALLSTGGSTSTGLGLYSARHASVASMASDAGVAAAVEPGTPMHADHEQEPLLAEQLRHHPYMAACESEAASDVAQLAPEPRVSTSTAAPFSHADSREWNGSVNVLQEASYSIASTADTHVLSSPQTAPLVRVGVTSTDGGTSTSGTAPTSQAQVHSPAPQAFNRHISFAEQPAAHGFASPRALSTSGAVDAVHPMPQTPTHGHPSPAVSIPTAPSSASIGGPGGGEAQGSGDQGPSSTGDMASPGPGESPKEDDAWVSMQSMRVVEEVMASPVRWIHKDADLSQAKALMSQFHISALLVDTGTSTPGFISKRDFLKVSFSKNLKRTRVRDIMTTPVISLDIGTPLNEAAKFIELRGVRRVLVRDPQRASHADPLAPYVGVVSDTDIFRVLGGARPGGAGGHTHDALADGLASRSSAGPSMHSHAHSTMSSVSGLSMCSLAYSISSLSEQAKGISTEDRYRAAAALWELDFSEVETIRKIGEGSFGEVLLGNFRGTKVAVKRMRGFEMGDDGDPGPSPTMMPVFAQFFEREIEIMATIRHPNVVNFIGACHTPPNVCLVTEYCARGSLDHLLHKSGLHLDLVKKVEFGMDIARGMSCLHAQRPAIIHRDLKTANLLVSARFEVKVADFGLSRIKDHAQLINSRAGLEGTVEYCAPEVLRGEPYTEKCDIWSYGVVLWELFNRQRPYADADCHIYVLIQLLGNGSLTLPPIKEEQYTPGLGRLVERCLTWNPVDRPSFREVLHLLENEYKVVRGKAAAVPRSDSASSMVVLNSAQAAAAPSGTDGGGGQPGAAVAPNLPPQVAHALGPPQLPLRPPGLPTSPMHPRNAVSGAGAAGAQADGERTSGGHMSRFAQAPGGNPAPVVQGANVAHGHHGHHGHGHHMHGHSHAADTGNGEHPHHAHHASQQQQQQHHGRADKSGRPPRGSRMQRARSTPLPAHLWFEGEPEDSEDTGTSGTSNTDFELVAIPEHHREHLGTGGSGTPTGTATGASASPASTRDASPLRHPSQPGLLHHPVPQHALPQGHSSAQHAFTSPTPVRPSNLVNTTALGVSAFSTGAALSPFGGFSTPGFSSDAATPSSGPSGSRLGDELVSGDDAVEGLRFGHTTWGLHMISELQDEGVTPSATPQPSAPSSLAKQQGAALMAAREARQAAASPTRTDAAGQQHAGPLEGAASGVTAASPRGTTSLSVASSGHTGAFFSPFAAALSQDVTGFGSPEPATPTPSHKHSLSAFSPFSAMGLQQEAFGRRSLDEPSLDDPQHSTQEGQGGASAVSREGDLSVSSGPGGTDSEAAMVTIEGLAVTAAAPDSPTPSAGMQVVPAVGVGAAEGFSMLSSFRLTSAAASSLAKDTSPRMAKTSGPFTSPFAAFASDGGAEAATPRDGVPAFEHGAAPMASSSCEVGRSEPSATGTQSSEVEETTVQAQVAWVKV